MKDLFTAGTSRRKFLSSVFPACAVTCIGSAAASAIPSLNSKGSILQEVHKFRKEEDHKFSNLQLLQMNSRAMVRFARTVEKKHGKDAMIELVKETARDRILPGWKTRVTKFPDRSLKTIRQYAYPMPQIETSHTIEIIEDTDKIFEIRVTECLYAAAFKELNAMDIGYATECWAYFMMLEEFNPFIELTREKSLMQGDGYCHYRYVMTE